MRNLLLFACSIFFLFFSAVNGSVGDQLDEFQRCVKACVQSSCSQEQNQNKDNNEFLVLNFTPMPLAFGLKCLLWDCELNCDYQCQDVINFLRKKNSEELYQFHGKWFFIRYFNIQEPASCIFSIFNFVSHYLGYGILQNQIIRLRKLNLVNNLPHVNDVINLLENYQIMALITMGAWTFSTIFHLRDLDVTEKLDYFFAGATVLSGLYVVALRLTKIYTLTKRGVRKALYLRIVLFLVFFAHVIRLLIDWDYTYNMTVNVIWAIIQYGLWFTFSIFTYIKYSKHLLQRDFQKKRLLERIKLEHSYTNVKEQKLSTESWYLLYLKYGPNWENIKCLTPIALSIWVSCGLIFELFDFPPWEDMIDAHSLWHLTTILPGYFWYYWMVWDAGKIKEEIF